MPDSGYSRSPILLKGALVELSKGFLGPVPNIIVFQYNPETMTRTLNEYKPNEEQQKKTQTEGVPIESSTVQPGDPIESFSLTLDLDATDGLEHPELNPLVVLSGVADRIAALEMLLYPVEAKDRDTVASVEGSTMAAATGAEKRLPNLEVPVVLFIWGPGRIVPVRLDSFQVEEQAFSPLLYPIRARVTVGMKVVTFTDPQDKRKKLAAAVYKYTRKQKQILAASNLVSNAESILGRLVGL
jgi:hypothetical protein